ncbi:UNKNOWN [Stylonychia lemnae]|uniref:Uncharacterized protein n=1 Tax=Stylonychia lemnae TaxID=5949 RepID=A0A078AUH4_STYLE|nr:UNKNOWN [Stylonychia lemnae]|eukprot:CDW85666.1 UNKNOWN [Stylonychia lemnae]
MIQSTNANNVLNNLPQKNSITMQEENDKRTQKKIKELEEQIWFLKEQLEISGCLKKFGIERYQKKIQQQQNAQNSQFPRQSNPNDLIEGQSSFNLQRNRSNELHHESVVLPFRHNSLEQFLERYARSDEINHTIADDSLKTQMNYYEPGYESDNNPSKLNQPKVKLSIANPFIEESKILENQSNDPQNNTEYGELFNMSQAGIISSDQYILSKEPNSNEKPRRVGEKELISRSSQVELSRFSKQLSRNVCQLSNQQKQNVICYNDHDNKIIVGQNDNKILILDSEMQVERSLPLESELISILKLNELFFFGMMEKIVIVFGKDLKEVVKRIETRECVYKFIYYQHQDPNLDFSKEYLILLEKEGFIQFFSFQEQKIVSTRQLKS